MRSMFRIINRIQIGVIAGKFVVYRCHHYGPVYEAFDTIEDAVAYRSGLHRS